MVSPYLPSLVSLSLSLYLSPSLFGRQVVSVSLDVSLHINGFICFPLWLVVSPFWVVLSGSPSVSLYVSSFMCLLFWLVVPLSECLLFALTWLPSFFLTICLPIHLSPNSCVFISLPYSGDVWFFPCFSLSVSHFHLSPHSYVSPSGRCPVLISSRFHLWLTLIPVLFSHYVLLLSQLLHQHRPQIAIRWKNVSCDSCCSHLRWTKHCQHQELLKPQTCTQALQ